ncbi:MAG TPA: hypothetical protein VI451_02510 [Anaerolineales bacterium]|nr:hypothetical protein [Anaerolineales bacterium]
MPIITRRVWIHTGLPLVLNNVGGYQVVGSIHIPCPITSRPVGGMFIHGPLWVPRTVQFA